MAEFRDARMQQMDDAPPDGTSALPSLQRDLHWQKPDFGTIKVNTDGAWCKDSFRTSGFAGILHAASGTGNILCHSAAAAEAITILHALSCYNNLSFRNVVVESDAKSIIQMLKKETTPDCSLDCILGDIENLACGLESVKYVYTPHACNRGGPFGGQVRCPRWQ